MKLFSRKIWAVVFSNSARCKAIKNHYTFKFHGASSKFHLEFHIHESCLSSVPIDLL